MEQSHGQSGFIAAEKENIKTRCATRSIRAQLPRVDRGVHGDIAACVGMGILRSFLENDYRLGLRVLSLQGVDGPWPPFLASTEGDNGFGAFADVARCARAKDGDYRALRNEAGILC